MSEQKKQPPTVGEVLAANVRRLREARGWRQADLAERMAPVAGWTASTVAWVENGRRAIAGDELVVLCLIFSVPLGEMLDGKGSVAVGELAMPLLLVRRQVMGQGANYKPTAVTRASVAASADARDDERKAAASLGVTPARFALLMRGHYGRPLHIERDERAGDVTGLSERAGRAKRGHATRAILAELRQAIETHGQRAVANGEGRP